MQGSLQDPWEREAGYHVRVETKAMTAAENKNKPNTDCSTRLSNAPQAEQQLIPKQPQERERERERERGGWGGVEWVGVG